MVEQLAHETNKNEGSEVNANRLYVELILHLNALLNHHLLRSEMAITFCIQLCSANCTALQMKNRIRNSAINPWPAHTQNRDNKHDS